MTNQLPPPEQESYEKIETPSKKETLVPKKSLSSSKKRQKAEKVLEALYKMQAVCRIGIPYRDYGQILRDTATTVHLYFNNSPDGPEEFNEAVNSAMVIYKEVCDLWGCCIDHKYYIRRSRLRRNPICRKIFDQIVEKYFAHPGIFFRPDIEAVYNSSRKTIDCYKTMALIWPLSDKYIQEAKATLQSSE